MAKAHIEGEVDVKVLPSKLEVQWTDNQINVKYAGETSVIPLNDEGHIDDRAEKFVADVHNGDIVDLAIGAYETHHMLTDEQ